MIRKILFLSCVTGLLYFAGVAVPSAMAQQTATLTGKITNAKTGEAVAGPNVFLVENHRGAASNAQGGLYHCKYSSGYLHTAGYVYRISAF